MEGFCFEDACEIASRHFGLNAGSSCIGEAWELRSDWVFMSDWRPDGTRARVSVSKGSGFMSDLGADRRPGMRPMRRCEQLEVPWTYLSGRKAEGTAEKGQENPRSESRKP